MDAKLAEREAGLDRALDRMKRSIACCDNIIAELLDYAGDHAPQIEPTDVDAWLADVMADQDLPPEISLEMHLTCNGATVGFDRELFRRVIIDLV